jgi:hypothetical protein
MNTKDYESDLFGSLRLGVVESFSPDSFRAIINFPDSLSTVPNVVATPSAHFGYIPSAGTVAVVYDKPGWSKQVIGYLSELNERTPEEVAANGENDPIHIPHLAMKPGDTYIGKYGRAYFNSAGDVAINTFHSRATIELSDKDATVILSGYNFELSTPGKGVRFASESSLPGLFGDSISIQKNVPSPIASLPSSLNPAPLVKVTDFTINSVGDVSLDVGIVGILPSSYFSMDVVGDISLGNVQKAALNIYADTEVDLHNPLAGLKMNASGVSTFSTSIAEVYIDTLGTTKLSSRAAPGDPVASASLMLNGVAGVNTMFGTVSNVFNANTSNIFSAPAHIMTGILDLNGPLNLVGAAGAIVSTGAMTVAAPNLSVTSPSMSFNGSMVISGNTAIAGKATITGDTSVIGNTSVTGILSVLGLPALSGLPSSAPFLSMVEIAYIPVTILIGGVPVIVGRIPVHA